MDIGTFFIGLGIGVLIGVGIISTIALMYKEEGS